MDDLKFGKRNKRGDWAPFQRLEIAPFYRLPPRPMAILRWLPGYFLPWNLVWAASAVAYWHLVVPAPEAMQSFHWGWILRLFAVNCALVFLFYGAIELRLYMQRAQGNRFKYNGKFPSDQKNDAFLFSSQNADGIIRGFGTGVPIWTAFEVLILWAYANGYVPWMSFAEHPLYLFALFLVLPIWHEAHFFCIHRLIHWGPLYKWIHSVHHNSVNPSPWSSLSMHPIEHLLYFSSSLIHLVIPSNPILAIYQLHYSGFGAVVGHIGFDKIEVSEGSGFDSHAYAHYLHHKFFEVNYGDGLVPLDKLFGTWHDGSAEAEARMEERFRRKVERMNRKRGAQTPAE
ncbi:sterol desaturase family protein [Rubellimicrobium arenae]|uniref:sterol desaturase family protein n=1 Tax=Rubellimicrobium arenae TaxID=2817372 RepID=UPI001B318525|nr:sterol desaturase family protein [Rubellimicrobium arenae]